jgi:hypothetical protein
MLLLPGSYISLISKLTCTLDCFSNNTILFIYSFVKVAAKSFVTKNELMRRIEPSTGHIDR